MTTSNICEPRFMCAQQWEELLPTSNPKTRFCDRCSKNVFAIRTHLDARVAEAVGRCVALTNDNNIVGWIGEPIGGWDWLEEESDTIKVRFGNAFPAELVQQLRMAFPRVFTTDVDSAPGKWIELGTYTSLVAGILNKELREQFPGLEIASETL